MSERSSRTLLALSLAFNILLVGAAVGAASMWYWSRPPGPAAGQRGLWLAAKNLSVEQRQAFRKMLAEARREVRQDTERARMSREELARLLVQDRLDTAAINAELITIRNADAVLRVRLEQAVVSFAETLSVADRQIFLEGLRGRGSMLRRAPPRKN
jgi:uncharacterized membrane protein